jgi:hypothetical protein
MENDPVNNSADPADPASNEAGADRRQFLSTLGRFSLVTPPVVTMLLSTSLTSKAVAQSGGGGKPSGGPPGGGIIGIILGWLGL